MIDASYHLLKKNLPKLQKIDAVALNLMKKENINIFFLLHTRG